MNIKKRSLKIFGLVFLLSGSLLSIVSCGSTDQVQEIYSAINYTQEDVVKDEVKIIENLLTKKPVEALWRSYILVMNVPDCSQALEVYSKCEDEVASRCSSSIESKDYLNARRFYEALSAVGYKKLSSLKKNKAELNSLIESALPLGKNSSSGEKVSARIKGTVTVFVDKGIKIESGVGHNDTVLGSGFFITRNGYIVTNHHVISDCVDPAYNGFARLYIRLAEDPETRIPARVVGYDKTMDLALLKTEVDAPYVFSLGSSSDLEIGDRVYVIGSPLGLDRTLTSGIVSATDRDLLSLGKVFQIDAAVSPGNSGGPMIDDQGRVQAIVFAGVQPFHGLNFAIPVEDLKVQLPFLFAGGKRNHGWMEAYGKTKRTPGVGAKNEGVEVLYAMPGGRLSFAGIKAGDIITGLDDVKITSLDDLQIFLLGKSDDSIVKVKYLTADESGAQEKTVPVYLSNRPENPGFSFYSHDLISSALYPVVGMELVRSSTSNKRLYTVKRVLKGSFADENGFSEGDPVQILNCSPSDDKTALIVEIYAKKKRNGYLDYGMSLGVPLDGSQYF